MCLFLCAQCTGTTQMDMTTVDFDKRILLRL